MQQVSESASLPEESLLCAYRDQGAYTDCFTLDAPFVISHAEYVTAFYTSRLFKVERAILKWALAMPSTDDQAAQLAAGSPDNFAAWRVEGRSENQLLLCDYQGRTRSWLMTEPISIDGKPATRLCFGSAVVPVIDRKSGKMTMSMGFRLLLGFHRLYARALLSSAGRKLAGPEGD